MRDAMAHASVGDDVYGDDPTVNELEALAAKKVGKEDALFVPSGTFGNQLALFSWCPRGSEVILGEQCHIIQHEAGAASVIAGVQVRPIDAPKGILSLEAIEARVRGDDIHYPPTSLICIENAHSSGRVVSLDYMKDLSSFARKNNIPIHLDGARIFNAAVSLGVEASEIGAEVDSVMFCLSKGLCAPIGSILAGSSEFISTARRKRKLMGGGMRQLGILAAAGIIAIEEMTKRLDEDHRNAKYLAQGLGKLPGVLVEEDALDINMIFFSIPSWVDGRSLAAHMERSGILINPPENGLCRFVVHYWTSRKDIDCALLSLGEYLSGHRVP
jgi:threonine aldolase